MAIQGIYVHVPFCRAKCRYCSFFSVPGCGESEREEYVGALVAEIAARGTREPADTIYMGGGTPTLLHPGQIERVLEAVGRAFQVDPAAEVTMEANPETVAADALRAYRSAGVNRISFGVQSLDDRLLRFLGRIHTADRARRAIEEARAAGFGNIGADLLFGIPGQSAEDWRRDLRAMLAMPVQHLSCYELTVEEGTRLAENPSSPPDEDTVLAQWDIAMDETARAGFVHYEVSNYASPGRECRHNLKYWRDDEFFGFGAGAWGYRNGVRPANPKDIRQYIAGGASGFPPAETDDQPLPVRTADALILGLRLRDGIAETALTGRYGPGSLASFEPALASHLADGRLERVDGRLRLTRSGLLLANSVWSDILSAA